MRKLKIDPIILICSTSEVYGTVKIENTPISEKNMLNPASPYAVSKTFQDLLSQTYYKNFNLKIIITRMFSYFNKNTVFSSNWANQIAEIEEESLKF